MEVKDYLVVRRDSAGALEYAILAHHAPNGWQPQGGVAIYEVEGEIIYHQAMVKPKEKSND